jgi:hypothetical protein
MQSENSRLFLDTEYAVLKKFLISIKFILINLDNGFINQNSHVLIFSFSGVFINYISNFTQWCDRQYKQVQFSNCVCKYQMFMQKTGQVGFCPDK